MNLRRLTALASAAAFVVLGIATTPSCGSMEAAMNGPVEALVIVTTPAGAQEQVLVPSSTGRSCKAAVRELRNEQWDKAITGFHQALIDDPDDHRAHFGLGIAYEMSGHLPEAIAEYEAANRIPHNPVPMYGDALKRARAKAGK